MHQRCENPAKWQYKHYGARGIAVCDRWVSYHTFLADMGQRPEDMSLDRIDNEKGYSPNNCRWATKKMQANNCRTNRIIDLGHHSVNLCEAESIAGVPFRTI